MMGVEEVAISRTTMAGRSCKRRAAQHQLIDHKLAVVFAERAFDGAIAGIGRVCAAGPLPDEAERVVEMARARGDFPFHLSRQMFAAPARKRIRLVIAEVADRRVGIDWPQTAERHDVPLS